MAEEFHQYVNTQSPICQRWEINIRMMRTGTNSKEAFCQQTDLVDETDAFIIGR